jgi:hypothetical protein
MKVEYKSVKETEVDVDGEAVKYFDIILKTPIKGIASMSIPAESEKEAKEKLVEELEIAPEPLV